MDFKDKLKEIRLSKGMTQQDVALKLGITKATYSGYETGRRQPDVQKIKDLALVLGVTGGELLDVTPSEVITPEKPVTPEELVKIKKYRILDVHGKNVVDIVLDAEYDRMTKADETHVEHRNNITYINCYDLAVSAGIGEPLDSYYKTRIEIPTEKVPADAHYCLRINGDSMEPAYSDGDIVFVQRADCVREGEIGIFVLNGDGFIKRWGKDRLISLNPKYEPIRIHEYDALECQGRVLGKI